MSQSPTLLTASLDDIVFEGRNQAYGAYQLRQDYKQHLASAGGITMGLCALLLLSWVAWHQLAPIAEPIVGPEHPVEIKLREFKIEKPKQAVTAAPKTARVLPTHTAAPTIPTVVAKDMLVPPAPIPKPLALDAIVDGPTGPAVAGPTSSLAEAGSASEGGSDGTASTAAAPAVSGPYIIVEKMPEFAGGQAALLRYLQKNLRYPSRALASQTEGRVFLSFVVQADGSIADITILKGLGYGLDEEAERVVRQMPAWTPGYQSHHAVPVRFTLPLTFKIQ